MSEYLDTPYDCIDPEVGERIWRLDLPELPDEERRGLDAHVLACHACRLQREIGEQVRWMVRDGSLQASTPVRRSPWLERIAAVAVAAALTGVLMLPPRPLGDVAVVRGSDAARFERPVEGEVVRPESVRLSWTPVAGAARYVVRIDALDDSQSWQGVVEEPTLKPPAGAGLAPGTAYRALLSTQPADLLPPGRTSVTFRTGTALQVALHRLRYARLELQALGFGGLALLGLALVRRRLA